MDDEFGYLDLDDDDTGVDDDNELVVIPDEVFDAPTAAPSLILGAGNDAPVELETTVTQKSVAEMSTSEQKELADHIVEEIDDHPEGIPFLPLNLGKFCVWALENAYLPAEDGDGPESNPGVIITFAGPDDPRGTPFVLSRDRALKFASQLKKAAFAGPSVQQRAEQSGLSVPQNAASGGLILPPGVSG